MLAMEEAVAQLPQGFGFDWTGLSYQERMSSSQAPLLYAFSIFVIFLCLAALYESWTVPISILLVLPLVSSEAFSHRAGAVWPMTSIFRSPS
jgi:HAE1 family hydrophobic/amphiphilic exporter-1